jgi:hypothetical protein
MRCLWVFIMVLCLEWSSWHEVCVAFPFWHVLLMFRTLLMRGWIFTKLLNYILASPNCCETWWSCSWCHYEAIKYLTCSFGHVYHPMLNFVYLRSSRLYFFLHFWLDSCILNKGETFEHVLAFWRHLEGFQVVSCHFGLYCAPIWLVEVTGLTGQSVGPVHMLGTGLTSGVDRSDRSELSCCSYSILWSGSHAFV